MNFQIVLNISVHVFHSNISNDENKDMNYIKECSQDYQKNTKNKIYIFFLFLITKNKNFGIEINTLLYIFFGFLKSFKPFKVQFYPYFTSSFCVSAKKSNTVPIEQAILHDIKSIFSYTHFFCFELSYQQKEYAEQNHLFL